MTLLEMGLRARNAANALACMGSEEKNAALTAISQALLERSGEILAANREDIALAENTGLSKAMIERLTLTQERLAGIAAPSSKYEICRIPWAKCWRRAPCTTACGWKSGASPWA